MSSNQLPTVHFNNPGQFNSFLEKLKPQIALALPKHMNPDRLARLALTVFSSNPALAECRPHTIAASILTAAQLGLEPNVNGQGYLIPYKGTCTFVPGWKGLVDLAQRSGRCTVWTGAVFKGDDFDFSLGDNPYVRHKPGDEDDPAKLTHVYAIGRIKGQDVPVIEVWRVAKVAKHRDTFNKVGKRHYSFENWEMYARKIPLLQVLKYMPQSVELTAAMEASHAAEKGQNLTIDADTWIPTAVTDPDQARERDEDDVDEKPVDRREREETSPAQKHADAKKADERATFPQDAFDREIEGWKALLLSRKKTAAQVIAIAESKHPLTPAQKKAILDAEPGPAITHAHVAKKIEEALKKKDGDLLGAAGDLIKEVKSESERSDLQSLYDIAEKTIKE